MKEPGLISEITVGRWAAINAIGFGLAFLSFIPGMVVMDSFMPEGLRYLGPSAVHESLDPEALPDWLDPGTYRAWYAKNLSYHLFALALFGCIVGGMQARVLSRNLPASLWVAATAAGFVAVLCFEALERHIVVGPHAGPFEPLMISVGGGTLAGVAQWFILRRRGMQATRWLRLWALGVVMGFGVAAAVSIGMEAMTQDLIEHTFGGPLAEMVSWSRDLLILGVSVGGVAGAISARALDESVAKAVPVR